MALFVKPNYPVVRDPLTREPLPEGGAWVPEDSFWLTRLSHGDVSQADAPEAPHAAPDDAAPPQAPAAVKPPSPAP